MAGFRRLLPRLLAGWLGVSQLGLCYCWMATALADARLAIEPRTDHPASAHLAGLAILSRNIGPHQLRLSGLHEGYLAAPKGDPTP